MKILISLGGDVLNVIFWRQASALNIRFAPHRVERAMPAPTTEIWPVGMIGRGSLANSALSSGVPLQASHH